MIRRFPDGFRWGTATSSYQIEGAVAVDGRGPSIWDTFSHMPGRISDGTTGDVACDHYHRYREDVALLADLGCQDYRFSVAWPRVQPDGAGAVEPRGLDFYSRLVDALLERGIRPLVTLYHWDLPQALQDTGGWPARDTAARFADYATLVADRLGDRVESFATFNEPWCASFLGYATGAHAPGLRDNATAYRAAHHLLLAHGLAMQALRGRLTDHHELSITVNPVYTRPASDSAADAHAARAAELAQNQVFLDPLLRGELNAELVENTRDITDWSFVQDGDLALINAPLDFLGINFYNPHLVAAAPVAGADEWPGVPGAYVIPEPPPRTAMGWPVRPEAFTALLRRLHADYPNVPFVITENGAAFDDRIGPDGAIDDQERVEYVRAHLAAVLDAIEGGVDIRGYFLWSLLDNFEWALGLSKRFGIVYVDFDTLSRTPKASALAYKQVIADHGI